MRRAPVLSYVLWSTVGAAGLGACHDESPHFTDAAIDATPIDAEVAVDTFIPDESLFDAPAPVAQFSSTATMSADCGVAVPPTTDITVTNVGSGPLVLSSPSTLGGFTVTSSFPITIAENDSATIAVRPPASVIGTDLGGDQKLGSLSFTSNEVGNPTRHVDLSSTVNGANLELTDGATTITTLSFAMASSCPPPQNVFVRNTGNRPADLAVPSASGFGFSGFSPSSTVTGASGSIQETVTLFTLGPCAGSASVSYQATGTICTTTPLALTVSFSITGQSSCFCS